MSTVYQGNAGNVTPPTALTVTNVTNSSNATVTVSGTLPAGFISGVSVDITGVQGAIGANGTWVATVTGVSTFTITNGSAAGVYSSGGSVQPLYLQAITIPADGDTRSASSVNVPLEGLADQIAFLAVGSGQYKIQHYYQFGFLNDFSTLGTMPAGVAGGGVGDWTGTIATLQPLINNTGGLGGQLPVVAGDIALVSFTGTLQYGTSNAIRVGANIWYTNAAPPNASPSYTQIAGASAEFFMPPTPTTTAQQCLPFTVRATQTIVNTGLFDFKLRFTVHGGSTSSGDVNLEGGFFADCFLLRPTSLPQ